MLFEQSLQQLTRKEILLLLLEKEEQQKTKRERENYLKFMQQLFEAKLNSHVGHICLGDVVSSRRRKPSVRTEPVALETMFKARLKHTLFIDKLVRRTFFFKKNQISFQFFLIFFFFKKNNAYLLRAISI